MKSIHNIHGHTLPPHVVKPARALRTRHTESYANLRARTDAYKFSFLPRSIRAWNSLPPEIIAIQNPDSYRNAIATALRGHVNFKKSKNRKRLWKWVGRSSVQLEIKKKLKIYVYTLFYYVFGRACERQ